MTKTTTICVGTYRMRGYDADDVRLLRTELEQFGAVRLRPLELPEAGGSQELWLVVSFVGMAIASGIIEHVAAGYYESLSAAVLRFFRAKQAKAGLEPELSLRVSYDDLDLDIGPVAERDLAVLPRLARSVRDHLNSSGLRDQGVTRIVIGMLYDGAYWHEPHLQEWPENSRFWGVSLEGHLVITHIYDTETGLLAARPVAPHMRPRAADDFGSPLAS